jgi:predicted DsbA family dithiol-disulfide isomerase
MIDTASGVAPGMRVDIWSDVVCPWCYIGKRRFEAAAAEFEHGDELEVVWRSFELDPAAPGERQGNLVEHLARKYGLDRARAQANVDRLTSLAGAEGLEYHLEEARGGNTFDAHRLIHLGRQRGIQDAVKERLLAAYFTEGAPIGDRETLVGIGVSAGLDEPEVRAVLAGDAYADDVRADERDAQELGISGVPFFVVDGKFAVSGAQSPDVIADVLRRAWDRAHPMVVVGGTDGTCTDDSCAI